MKKKFIVVGFLFFSAYAFSQGFGKPFDISFSVLKTGLYGNEAKIQQQAPFLTELEKDMLYDTYKKDTGFSLFVRGGYGFGSHFYATGDISKGKTFKILDTVSGITSLVSLMSVAMSFPFIPFIAVSGGSEIYGNYLIGFSIAGGVSGLVLLSSHIYQFVKQSTYASSFNDDLKRALGVSDATLSAFPFVDLKTGDYALRASLKIRV